MGNVKFIFTIEGSSEIEDEQYLRSYIYDMFDRYCKKLDIANIDILESDEE